MQPRFFASSDEFRAWLEANHDSESEVVVGFHKKHTGLPSLTWTESVREALCFGWIDGVRRRIHDDSYAIRFTPRKQGSNWSVVNVRHVEELTRAGRMHPAGLEAFEARTPEKTGVYTYENRHEAKLSLEHEEQLQANEKAWEFFQAQPPGYRQTAIFWVVSAKREETRARRLATLIDDSAHRRRIGLFRGRGS
ncbi:MAG TPA: YdeI/OmpD-associated family protein [Gaiellaceae bacterium]|nr:YdeI/OmpD-associated family protein [Gaiellaceae bacterium]